MQTSGNHGERIDALRRLFDSRVAVLDGAWGTMFQNAKLSPEDYLDDSLRNHSHDVTGDPDLLNLTRPDVVLDVHRQYLDAGADITTTNTFTATSIGQADYALQHLVREMNIEGAGLARKAADEAGGKFVAGSIGPLNVTLSLSPRVEDPAFRAVSFDQVRDAYAEQISALAEGGVDLLLVETIFDTLNAKAAIAAAREVAPHLPLWISVTIVDLSGRTLSGQTVEAFFSSIEHANPLVVGVNCSLGATEMRPHIAELSRLAGTYVASHPNAGLPNAFGGYDQTPEQTGVLMGEFAAGRDREHRRRLLRHHPGAHREDRVVGPGPCAEATAGDRRAHPVQRVGAVRDRRGHRVRDDRRAHQRHGVQAVPQADRERQPPGRGGRGAGAGARRRQPARREHGRRPAGQ